MGSFGPAEIQKAKLEKLMQNIDKPIEIPERRKDSKFADPPEFVRNVMGSSAGAGSGEFHVYRHLRRKEYARQRFIDEQAKKEELDRQYRDKLEELRRQADEKTAKKRAKRLKKKQKVKGMKKKKTQQEKGTPNSPHSSEDENGDTEEQITKSGCSDSDDETGPILINLKESSSKTS